MRFDWSIYRKIIGLGLPILVGQIGMIVTGFADTMMVGRYSTDALAAASFVNNLFNMAVFACIGFTYGVTPLVGALYGRGRGHEREAGAVVRMAMTVNVAFSLLVTAIMAVVYANLHRLGQPPELLPIIRPYYRLFLWGMPSFAIFGVLAQWCYGINNTGTPMWAILSSNAGNILGNWLLIYGNWGLPELGLQGAGIATLSVRWMIVVEMLIFFFAYRRNRPYAQGFMGERLTWKRFREVNRTSWPVSLQMTFESGSFSIAALFTGWLGAVPLAAYQIVVMVGTLGFCVYYSIASAVSVLVSNAAGRADRREMRRVARAGYVIILTLAACSSMVFAGAGANLMRLFSEDTAVIAVATSLIFPLVLYQFADATQITFSNALRGTSNVMPMLWISFVSYIVIGLPATYLLGFPCGLGVYGIVLSFSVSLISAAVLFLWKFYATTRATDR